MSNYDNLIGQVLDRRYQIVKSIGTGGMSIVFEAVDLMNNRPVAIKILKEEMSGDLQAVKRFINESKAVSLLSHPGIVRIYDVVISRDLKYIVMERVQGITLKSYIEKKGPLSLQEILSYTEQILRALIHAHSKGIIHRDIKPQNVLLLKNGRIKVADFGIAKLPNAETVTMTDKAIGTVYYISPEQASARPIDPRSDLYSLGVCMYEMATGTLPFLADSPVSVALMQVNDRPRPPREIIPSIPFGLEQIILGAMEKDPNRRFQDAKQMLRHVSQLRTDPAFVFRTKRVRRSETELRALTQSGGALTSPPAKASIRRILDPKAVSKKPMKKKKKQSSSMFPIIAGVALAFFMVCIVCGYVLLTSFLEMQDRLQPITVTVPDFIGDQLSEDYLAEYSEDLYSFVFEYVQSDEYEENTIIDQEPSAGTSRKVQINGTKCVVTLTVSCAERTFPLPDFTITDYRVAQQELSAWGISTVEVREFNANIDIGHVIRTVPTAGTPLKRGETVTLYISRGPELKNVIIPDFIGDSTGYAYEQMFDREGNQLLKVGELSYAYSDEIGEGLIMQQSKPPYTSVLRGSAIDFVISLGPAPVTDTGDSSETGDSPESGDSSETGDSAESGDSSETGDSAESGDSTETGDSNSPDTSGGTAGPEFNGPDYLL